MKQNKTKRSQNNFKKNCFCVPPPVDRWLMGTMKFIVINIWGTKTKKIEYRLLLMKNGEYFVVIKYLLLPMWH